MNKPLVYFFVSFIVGIIIFIAYSFSYIMGFIFMFFFILLLTRGMNYKEVLINLIIVIFSFYNVNSYFNLNLPKDYDVVKVRICDKKGYKTIGSMNGKMVYIKDLKKGNIGEVIYAKGNFKKEIQYDKGIIGELLLTDEIIREKDLYSKIIEYRSFLDEEFQSIFGLEEGVLLSNLCFGDNSSIDIETKDKLKSLGVIHVISVSGFHIALVYKLAYTILGGNVALLVTFFYGIFTGGKSSTWRAIIMIFLSKVSLKLYRNYDGVSALSLSGIILLIVKPHYLMDVGFCLSFLATLGIIFFQKTINNKLYKLPSFLREPISITMSAQVFTFPYMVFTFGNFNLGFLIGNLFLVPVFTILIILGNFGAVLLNTFLIEYIKYFVEVLMKILNGGIYILHGISPKTSYLSYLQGCIVIAIYICYLLVKKGEKKYTYLPLFLCTLIIFEYYKPYTEIKVLSILGKEAFIISHKKNNILLTNSDKIGEDIIKGYHIDEVKNIGSYPLNFNIKDKNHISVEIINIDNGEKQISITVLPIEEERIFKFMNYRGKKNYDIILLKPKKQVGFRKTYETNSVIITDFNIYNLR